MARKLETKYPRYEDTAGKEIVRVSLRKEEEVREVLARFSARVIYDEHLDNGDDLSTEDVRVFVVDVRGRTQGRITPVAGDQFPAVRRWANNAIGIEAGVTPGKEALVEDAIRQLSEQETQRRTRFASTGWRPGAPPFFVHRGGVVGEADRDYIVDILGVTSGWEITPAKDVATAVVSSLALVELGPFELTVPLLLSVYRAALPIEPRYSVLIFGPTGSFKTAIALVLLSHAGVGIGEEHLSSWTSTANYLTRVLYHFAGLPYVIDDDAPDKAMSIADKHRKSAIQEHVFRSVGNRSGRGRMRPDTTLRETYRPRALLISTGEDAPAFNQSILARILSLPVSSGDIRQKELTRAQALGRKGIYCGAFHAWIEWLSSRHKHVHAVVDKELQAMRAQENDVHARFVDMEAELRATAKLLFEFAVELGALDRGEASETEQAFVGAVQDAIATHGELAKRSDPIDGMFEAIMSGLLAGRCHVAEAETGGLPPDPELWGWQYKGQLERSAAGACIGHVSEDRLYLDPQQTLKFVGELYLANGRGFPLSKEMVGRYLSERGLSIVDEGRYTAKRNVSRRRPRVWDVPTALIELAEDADGA
jgi:hypothetical protein